MRKAAFLVAFLSGASSPALAGYKNGNDIFEYCSSSMKGRIEYSYCQGYVSAVADAFGGPGNEVFDFKACIPDGVTLGQVVDVVSDFLTRNPKFRHYGAASLIAGAISQAWPCK